MPLPFCLRSGAGLLVALLVATSLAAGCASERNGNPAEAVTDDLGRAVALEGTPQRVVTLAPNLTEIVFAAGAGRSLAGITTADDFPPAARSLPRVGALPVDFEAIAALRPDLVLATDQVNAPRDAETFAALGIPVYFFSFPTLESVLEGVERVGALLGTEAKANRATDSLVTAIRTLRARTASAEDHPRVLFLVGDETLYAFGQGSYVHTLIALAGGRSITRGLDAKAPTLSEEYVLEEKPDVIIGAFGADYDPARLQRLHPTWDVVPAVQRGRVYSLDQDLVLRPGPRLVRGAQQMARMLHPALFEENRRAQPEATR